MTSTSTTALSTSPTLKELCKRWYHDLYTARPQKLTAHRALDDIRESIAELVYYRELLFRTPEELKARSTASSGDTGPSASQVGGSAEPAAEIPERTFPT